MAGSVGSRSRRRRPEVGLAEKRPDEVGGRSDRAEQRELESKTTPS